MLLLAPPRARYMISFCFNDKSAQMCCVVISLMSSMISGLVTRQLVARQLIAKQLVARQAVAKRAVTRQLVARHRPTLTSTSRAARRDQAC